MIVVSWLIGFVGMVGLRYAVQEHAIHPNAPASVHDYVIFWALWIGFVGLSVSVLFFCVRYVMWRLATRRQTT